MESSLICRRPATVCYSAAMSMDLGMSGSTPYPIVVSRRSGYETSSFEPYPSHCGEPQVFHTASPSNLRFISRSDCSGQSYVWPTNLIDPHSGKGARHLAISGSQRLRTTAGRGLLRGSHWVWHSRLEFFA